MNPSPTVLIGNITQDPELTFTSNGQARLGFSIACNYVWYDQAGEKQEKVSYFNIVAWRYVAENAGRVLEKGLGVVVIGRLEQRSYETKEGEKRSTVELVADEISINARSIEEVVRRKKSDGEQNSNTRRKTTERAPVTVGADDEPF